MHRQPPLCDPPNPAPHPGRSEGSIGNCASKIDTENPPETSTQCFRPYHPCAAAQVPLRDFGICTPCGFAYIFRTDQKGPVMAAIVEVKDLRKTYKGGFDALKGVSLTIEEGEILALLGPNGAGKTTLISALCGITNATSGTARVGGHDIVHDYRAARSLIGLVPQEVALEPFEKVINTINFSRGVFGKPKDDALTERVLRQLSLWEKRHARIRELSGGMKRRVLIAKALCHEPRVLFLDEPTAGVDVELRRDMWQIVEGLKADGVTIILTTHYIEEAEAIADRVGSDQQGRAVAGRGQACPDGPHGAQIPAH